MGAVQMIVDECRKRGIVVHEWDGWKTRGNGGVLDLDVEGIILHHTGSGYGSAYPELVSSKQPWAGGGALCNFSGNADGSLTVIAAGLAYHAGGGFGPNQGPLAAFANDRNRRTVGLEIVYPGTQAMKSAQYSTAVALSRVVVDLFQNGNAEYVRAHAEVNGKGYEGKWDPGSGNGSETIDMNAFRTAVRNWTGGDDVELDDSVKTTDGRWVYVKDALGAAPYASLLLEKQAKDIAALKADVAKLQASGVPVDLKLSAADKADIAKLVLDGLASRMEN